MNDVIKRAKKYLSLGFQYMTWRKSKEVIADLVVEIDRLDEGWKEANKQRLETELQLSRYQSKYNNLLAVLHRDGGQYLNEHGEQKASEDGITKVLTAYQDNDRYHEGVEVEGISFIGACHNSITFNKSEKAKLYPFDVGQRVKVLVMPIKEDGE